MRDAQSIKSRADFGPGEGPRWFSPRNSGELIGLSGEFFFHHHDLCRFHFAVVRVTRERLEDLKGYVDKHRDTIDATFNFESDDAIVQSRLREYATSWELEINSVQGYGDQLFVVGLWALAEQYCTRALAIAERTTGSNRTIPFGWSAIEKRIRRFSVDVRRCESFKDANECRVVNNKVKHLGIVDDELAAYPPFRQKVNWPLNRVEIDLQRYSNSVFEFVGWVLEDLDDKLPAHRSIGAQP